MIEAIKAARILVVDDEPANVRLLERMLGQAGYENLLSTRDSREVFTLAREFAPDLILLDLHMPGMDGFEVMEKLRSLIPPESYLPILVLTADITPAAEQRALEMGAKDFVAKPLRLAQVLLRIQNLLETRFLHLRLRRQNETLEERVRARTLELEEARVEMLERLTQAAEFRDDDTGQHARRVGDLSARTATALGLDEEQVELIRRAAPLHDMGKIAIPDAILLKPGRLTPDEFEVMKTHTTIGARMLAGGRTALMRLAEEIALAHHERWDGSGYPSRLAGPAIPLAARIVAVADFYDALAHDRPYRSAWPEALILAEIERQSGKHFDPCVAEVFLGAHHSRLSADSHAV
jgi:putative two-component system response regulator